MTGGDLAAVFNRLAVKYEKAPRFALAQIMVTERVLRAIEFRPVADWPALFIDVEKALDHEVAAWTGTAKMRALGRRIDAALGRLEDGEQVPRRKRRRRGARR